MINMNANDNIFHNTSDNNDFSFSDNTNSGR